MVVVFYNFHSSVTKTLKYQSLPLPYVGSYEGEKGNLLLKEKWILDLAKLVWGFVMVSISDLLTVKYWKHLEKTIIRTKKDTKRLHNWIYIFYVIGNNWRKFIQ